MTLIYELLHIGAKPPVQSTDGAAGYDLFLPESFICIQNRPAYIPLGIKFDIPAGYYLEVVPRSSTLKRGLMVPVTIVDSDYTGEVYALLWNLVPSAVELKAGERIVQFIIRRSETLYLSNGQVDKVTIRSTNGCGSTGL